MDEEARALVERIHREAAAHYRNQPPRSAGRRTIHYTELTEAEPGSPLFLEWNTYRREVGRLLAEGHEGKFVLIKGEQIVGFFDTFDSACDAGVRAYLLQPFLAHQILTEEPLLSLPACCWPCRS